MSYSLEDEVEKVRPAIEAAAIHDSDSEPEHVPLTKNEARNQPKIKETGIDKKPPKARAKKSAVPLGSNGKPKKRVVKSRKKKNEKGFIGKHCASTCECCYLPISLLVAEDYSSYESVSGSEDDEAKADPDASTPPPKKKAASKPKASAKEEKEAKPTKAKAKPRASSAKETKEVKEAKEKDAAVGEGTTNSGKGAGSSKSAAGKSGQKNLMSFFTKQ